jgi:hypothetical protein
MYQKEARVVQHAQPENLNFACRLVYGVMMCAAAQACAERK